MDGNSGTSQDNGPREVPEFSESIGRWKSGEVSSGTAEVGLGNMAGNGKLLNSHSPAPPTSAPTCQVLWRTHKTEGVNVPHRPLEGDAFP